METNTRTFECGSCTKGIIKVVYKEKGENSSVNIEKCTSCKGQYYLKQLSHLKETTTISDKETKHIAVSEKIENFIKTFAPQTPVARTAFEQQLKMILIEALSEGGPKYTNHLSIERRSGRSTRLADAFIQELATKGSIKVIDHEDNISPLCSKRLYNIIINRLKAEHGNPNQFICNEENLTISLRYVAVKK